MSPRSLSHLDDTEHTLGGRSCASSDFSQLCISINVVNYSIMSRREKVENTNLHDIFDELVDSIVTAARGIDGEFDLTHHLRNLLEFHFIQDSLHTYC